MSFALQAVMNNPVRVLLVDDHELLRTGLRALIAGQEDLFVVGEVSTGEAAIEQARRVRPDVIVMDVRLPGMNGIEATRCIVKQDAAARVLVLTTDAPEDVLLDIFEAGGSGYVRKSALGPRVVDAIRAVAAGKVVADPALVYALKARSAGA